MTPDGTLLFTSDRTNWWNVYALRGDRIEALAPLRPSSRNHRGSSSRDARTARRRAHPLRVRSGRHGAPRTDRVRTVRELPYGPIDTTPLPFRDGTVYLATPADAPAAVCYAPKLDDAAATVIRSASAQALDPGGVSIGEALTFRADDGEDVHAFFYPPRNAHTRVRPGERPPLIVMSHGGPTAMHTNAFGIGIQYYTSRALRSRTSTIADRPASDGSTVDVWPARGVEIDVRDCITVARALAAGDRCDPARIAIRGSSASGMTALLAVATSDVFAAAVSSYGVMELEALAADTHKFEARYTDGLVRSVTEMRERYRDPFARDHVATIDVPVLLFQGLEVRVVPPDQATTMRDALIARNVPVVYEAFAGEGPRLPAKPRPSFACSNASCNSIATCSG